MHRKFLQRSILFLMALVSLSFSKNSNSQEPVRGSYIKGAGSICSTLAVSSSQNYCEEDYKDRLFDIGAFGICESLMFAAEKVSCLAKVAGKQYTPADIQECKETSDTNGKLNCLQKMGTEIPQGQVVKIIPSSEQLAELEFQTSIRAIIKEFQADRSMEYCQVQDSHGRFLGQVNMMDFRAFGSIAAKAAQSCMITNIKDERLTHNLFGRDGETLITGQTEKAIHDWFYYFGYDTCRTLICVKTR